LSKCDNKPSVTGKVRNESQRAELSRLSGGVETVFNALGYLIFSRCRNLRWEWYERTEGR